ncbi:MAG: valine--tRNA ligase [Gemmataceae bacterium]
MATELPPQYDPKAAQERFLAFWNERGYFTSRPDGRTPYTIVIPPPNVTGALHLGHALNNTLQDILIRWKRAQGFNALWIPGTDHAGIATQAMVEKRIRESEKKTRHDLGRDELVRRIWAWKDQYEARILGQLRSLGASCDWSRTRFTLDETCTRAVRQTFFQMFKDGLIFRGKRLVNWDAQLQTSVADDETYTETTKGGFWTFKYPVKELPGEFISFSTTRPETMLGDTAVCVHPSDERYKHLVGRTVTVPLVGRDIPIIADGLLADMTLGTGCVKVTPAHDPNDYAAGLRNKLPMITILTPDGKINENGGKYAGQERSKARDAVVADMEALGLFLGREDRDIPLKFSDRSKTPIEPLLSDQWFVRMDTLAQAAIEAVAEGSVKFFPERYARTYLDWLGEKRDWCISRQLWWGHRIPIWYTDAPESALQAAFGSDPGVAWRRDAENDQFLVCGLTQLDAAKLAGYRFVQDDDVLDTWFSSALWPHSTLGWPGQTADLEFYYPTSTLVTSRDIITLWVARMVITGLYNVGKIPFHHVYVHPKILDGFGETMSKTKGNGLDPLDIIDLYGTDALRFGMAVTATETQDSRMPVTNLCPHCCEPVAVKQEHMYMRTKKLACPKCKQSFRPGGPWPSDDPELPTAKQASDKFDQGRNFANKLWNAARFLLMNLDGYTPGEVMLAELPIEDRWILSRLATATRDLTAHLEGYRYSEAARLLYDFTWSEFCDWYVEMSKGRLRKDEGGRVKDEPEPKTDLSSALIHPSSFIPHPSGRPLAQRVLAGVLDGILRLAQPIMPFVTESIWQALNEAAPSRGLPSPAPAAESVCIAAWPAYPAAFHDGPMEARLARMQDLVRLVREVRNRYMVDTKTALDAFIRCSTAVAADFQSLAPFIRRLGGVGAITAGPETAKPKQAATQVHGDFEVYVSLAGLIDVPKEVARLGKQQAEKAKSLEAARGKLNNAGFLARAQPEVVQSTKDQVADLESQLRAIGETLADLAGGEGQA